MPEKIFITDSSLRSLELKPYGYFTSKEKLLIANALCELNVDTIDYGFLFEGNEDNKAIQEISKQKGPTLCISSLPNIKAIHKVVRQLEKADKPCIQIGMPVSPFFIANRQDELNTIEKANTLVEQAKLYLPEISFYMEDAGRANFNFLKELSGEVLKAGATSITLADSTGSCLPEQIQRLIRRLNQSNLFDPKVFTIHCHNEMGLATANSLAALEEGIRKIDCSINGIGSRAGFASLEELCLILKNHTELGLFTDIRTEKIHHTSQMVSEYSKIPLQAHKPVVGSNAITPLPGIFGEADTSSQPLYSIEAQQIGFTGNGWSLTSQSDKSALNQRIKNLGVSLSDKELLEVHEVFLERASQQKMINDKELKALLSEYLMSHLNF